MPKKESENLALRLAKVKTKNELAKLSESVEKLLVADPEDAALLHIRARIYVKSDNLGQAINDYKTILNKNPEDKTAALQIEQLRTILKFNNLDIYANPNTNFDPWLD